MMKFIILAILFGVLCACNKDNIETYNVESRYLFFSDSAGMDSTFISFSHYLGVEEHKVPFEIRMIGRYSDQELEYKVGVIDSLTTAKEGDDFELPEKISFSPGCQRDTLWVTLKKSDRLKINTLKVVLMLEENVNFGLGYPSQLTAKIVFNDQTSLPTWWNDDITLNFLGVYSEKKFLEFYKCTGVDDLSSMSASEKRKLTLEFKEYIEENNITEEDGSPMVVVAY